MALGTGSIQTIRRPPGALGTAAAGLLVVTALLPLSSSVGGLTGIAILAAIGVAIAATAIPRTPQALAGDRPLSRAWRAPAVEMLLYLSPVILLTAVFPFAAHRTLDVRVGGVPLMTLLLASSVTVPWLSQAVCLPLYRAIGPLVCDGDMDAITRRLCQTAPNAFLHSLPVIVVFAVPMQLVMSWSWTALATYVTLCALHIAFAQGLILANVGRLRRRWALAWACYALALLIVPTAWYLPPIVGLLSQLIPIRAHVPQMLRPMRLEPVEVVTDLIRGLLLGAVLWADKLALFLVTYGLFEVNAVFLALFPAILAYNYYFVRLAPHVDRSVNDVRTAMESAPSRVLARQSSTMSDVVAASVARTAFIGATWAVAVTVMAGFFAPDMLAMVAAVSVASLLFMMTTLASYKLDYIGYRTHAQLVGAVHLVSTVALFVALPAGPALYAWLAVVQAALFAFALRMCLTEWRSAEYALFWRHATAW